MVVRNEMVVGLEWWRLTTTGMTVLNFGAARSRVGMEAKNRAEQRFRASVRKRKRRRLLHWRKGGKDKVVPT
jgi:hypothetical protein